MKISVVCSSMQHPIWSRLEHWCKQTMADQHEVQLVQTASELVAGDFLFLVSCGELIKANVRANYRHVLVLHASDLPEGRGWSPYIWDVLAGKQALTLCLLEAEDKVDRGRIWFKQTIPLKGHELLTEIHEVLFSAEIELMTRAIVEVDRVIPYAQPFVEGDPHPLRFPADSEISVDKTVREQFNHLRVVDNERFPAFFRLHGRRYRLLIDDLGPDDDA
ncbi:formyltransferase family protein [Thalassolituus oleivorans]|uniref:formyltransferase family protein n=1 Tax=Thalassolituus oleivorans TaxID=187493 RepID=UPI0023EFDA5F|nr:formyltransferase family protein [Thalassolituus oleivorans]